MIHLTHMSPIVACKVGFALPGQWLTGRGSNLTISVRAHRSWWPQQNCLSMVFRVCIVCTTIGPRFTNSYTTVDLQDDTSSSIKNHKGTALNCLCSHLFLKINSTAKLVNAKKHRRGRRAALQNLMLASFRHDQTSNLDADYRRMEKVCLTKHIVTAVKLRCESRLLHLSPNTQVPLGTRGTALCFSPGKSTCLTI